MRLMGWITFINASVGIALGGLLYTIWPEHYFTWYPSIPIFYWLTAVAMTYFLDRVKKRNGDVTVTTFMVVRFCKFTLAIVFLSFLSGKIIGRLYAFPPWAARPYISPEGISCTVHMLKKPVMEPIPYLSICRVRDTVSEFIGIPLFIIQLIR